MIVRPKNTAALRAGFTLVESVVSLVLVAMVLSAAALVGSTSSNVFDNAKVRTDLESRLRRALDRVATELVPSGPSVVLPTTESPGWMNAIRFNPAEGATDGVVDWGPQARFAFEYEQGEADDGLDNDGDGSVDEGQLVLTRDLGGPTEKRVVLCHGVSELLEGETPNLADDNGNGLIDEPGFCLERSGSVVTVRLTLEAVDAEGQRITETVQTSVQLRN